MTKLKYKIILLLVIILLLTIGANNWISGMLFKQEFTKSASQEIQLIGESLKHQLERILELGLDIENLYEFDEVCREIVRKYPDVAHALVLNTQGEILYHSSDRQPEHLLFDKAPSEMVIRGNQMVELELTEDKNKLYAGLIPVKDEYANPLGYVLIALSPEKLTEATKRITLISIGQSVLFLLVALFLLIPVLTYWVTRPLTKIMQVMTSAGSGNLRAKVHLHTKDEFGELGVKLNETLEQIRGLMDATERAAQLQVQYASEQERSRLSESLRKALYAITASLDLDKVQHLVLEQLHSLLAYDYGRIWLKADNGWEPYASYGSHSTRSGMNETAIESIYQTTGTGENPATLQDPRGSGYVLAVPFCLREGQQVGMIVLWREGAGFETSEVNLAMTFAGQASIAVDNAGIYRQMEEMAVMDELTSLYNRRHFYLLAEKETEQSLAQRQPLALALFDIDHFKQVNDRYGHLVGDEVLRQVGAVLAAQLKDGQIAGRFGGEEFVLMLPDMNGEQAMAFAERLRREVSAIRFNAGHGDFQITISLGISELRADDRLEALIERADKALYEAKETGRDRVVLSEREAGV